MAVPLPQGAALFLVLATLLAGCAGTAPVVAPEGPAREVTPVQERAPEEATAAREVSYVPQRSGELQNPAMTEASGMAASRIHDNLFWVLNDGGNGPWIYAVGSDGSDRGRIEVEGARNRDWEDMASFVWNGRSYLLIADIGDNRAERSSCLLYIVPEPESPEAGSVPLARTIEYIYEDGPRDAESLAVDLQGERILILSKRDHPQRLYQLPLFPDYDGIQTARRIATIAALPQPSLADILINPALGKLGDVPTAMDIAADGSAAVVLTYSSVLRFVRSTGMEWAEVFSRPPLEKISHTLVQAEAAAFGSSGVRIYYTSERQPAPLWMLAPEPSPNPAARPVLRR
ncbi:MAG TPA: hypothetical protein ENJ43_00860 [Gammaproteobacteria bacterium]|nr:hypothetical protein [Gammaproteobacteria bacterium]